MVHISSRFNLWPDKKQINKNLLFSNSILGNLVVVASGLGSLLLLGGDGMIRHDTRSRRFSTSHTLNTVSTDYFYTKSISDTKIQRFRPPILFFNTFDVFPYTTVTVNPHRAHLGGDETCGTKETKVDIFAEIETLACHDFLFFLCSDLFLIYYSLSLVSKFRCAHLHGDGMIKYAGRKSCTMPLPDIRGCCASMQRKYFAGYQILTWTKIQT